MIPDKSYSTQVFSLDAIELLVMQSRTLQIQFKVETVHSIYVQSLS